jgi:hypothetical protein
MKKLLSVCLVFFAAALTVSAQETRGQILGRVTDPTGAVVAGAKIQALNTATGVVTTATSSVTGDYTLPFLVAGAYDITVELSGFKKFERKDITVQIQGVVTLNIALQLGSVTETMEVKSEAPILESQTSSLGQIVDTRRIQDLPVNYDNALMLASLGPGVTNLSTNNQTQTFTSSTPSSIAIDGVGKQDIAFTLDGAPNNAGNSSSTGGNIAYTPPSGVISEFKIETAIFDASRGFSAGSAISMSLKSGTNALHGQMYEVLQNRDLNANSYFSNLNGLPKDNNHQNQWGFVFNGPVIVPKVYNGKNKTFWMFGYEGISNSYPKSTAALYTIPTTAERGGDLSALLALGSSYQIYDPRTTVPTGTGHFQRSPFPGNIIPQSRLDPIAQNIMKTYLNMSPNTIGKVDGTQNYVQALYQINDFLSTVFRFDENISDKHRLFVRGNYSNLNEPDSIAFNQSSGWTFIRDNRGLGIDDAYVFNSSTILDARATYNRYVQGSNPISFGKANLSSLGFSQAFISEVGSNYAGTPALPNINVSGLPNLASDSVNMNSGDTYSAGADVTWVHRAHSFKFGGEYRIYRDDVLNMGKAFGSLAYSTNYTVATDTTPAATFGQGFASFLLGQPTSGSFDRNASYAQSFRIGSIYAQDSWKVNSRLTLNIGLRAEFERPPVERYDRTVAQFDATDVNPLSAAATANYAAHPIAQLPASAFKVLGGLTFAGVSGVQRNIYNSNNRPLMPRVGLAYQFDSRTVIRAGYAIFDDLERRTVNQTGFSQTTNLTASVDNGQSYLASTYNPFPGGLLPVLGSSQGLLTSAGNSISAFPNTLKRPYMQRWQLSIQRQIAKDTVVEVAYVGNRGTDLIVTRNYVVTPRQYLSTSPVRDTAVINMLSAAVPNPFYPLLPGTSLSGSTVATNQLLKAYPEFTGLNIDGNQGYSWYHGLQTQIQKRFSNGYTITGAFTWSKFMEATGYLNDTDATPEKVISSQDRPMRLVTSGIYELPFGRGRKFASGVRGIPGGFISGWQVEGIYQWQVGDAMGFGNVTTFLPISSALLPSSQRNIYQWFNTSAFDTNTADALSNNVRVLSSRFAGIRGPGISMCDLSALKNTRIREGMNLQFRGEFINALNHPQFSDPSTSVTSKAFGTITNTSQLPRTVQLGLKLVF